VLLDGGLIQTRMIRLIMRVFLHTRDKNFVNTKETKHSTQTWGEKKVTQEREKTKGKNKDQYNLQLSIIL